MIEAMVLDGGGTPSVVDKTVGGFVEDSSGNHHDPNMGALVGYEQAIEHPDDSSATLSELAKLDPAVVVEAARAEMVVGITPATVKGVLDDISRIESDSLERTTLPVGEELREWIETEVWTTVPSAIRLKREGETADITMRRYGEVDLTDPNCLQEVQGKYVRQVADRLMKKAWWQELSQPNEIISGDTSSTQVDIVARHTAEASYKGEVFGPEYARHKYEVYEVGRVPVDEEGLQTIYRTLELIDQYSGGFLSLEDQRVVLASGYMTEKAQNGAHVLGYNLGNFTFVSMDALRGRARETGKDTQGILGGVLIHEILGHALEHALEGETGRYFQQFFEYSEAKRPVDYGIKEVHDSIIPRDGVQQESKPMRRYGWTDSAEDFATSVEIVLCKAHDLEWPQLDEDEAHVDSYRQELVLEFLDYAARRVSHLEGMPGYVGAEVQHSIDEAGNRAIRPARMLEASTMNGEETVRDELRRIMQEYRGSSKREIVVDVKQVQRGFI